MGTYLRKIAQLAGLVFFLSCGSGKTEELISLIPHGLAFYHIQNPTMPCDWIRIFDGLPSIRLSFVHRVSGDSDRCLIRLLEDPRPKAIQIFLSEGVCVRKANCSDRNPSTGDQILEAGKEIAHIIDLHCKKCTISYIPQLEDDFTGFRACDVALALRLGISKIANHGFQIWRNPNIKTDPDFVCFDGVELHEFESYGLRQVPQALCSYSNDGVDLEVGSVWNLPHRITTRSFLQNVKTRFQHCFSYLWTATGNCLQTDSSVSRRPVNRSCPLDAVKISELNRILLEANQISS